MNNINNNMNKILYQQVIQNKNSIMTFGRYKGSRIKNLPRGYLWALYNYGWIKIAKTFYKEFKLMISRPLSTNRNYYNNGLNHGYYPDYGIYYNYPGEEAFRYTYEI